MRSRQEKRSASKKLKSQSIKGFAGTLKRLAGYTRPYKTRLIIVFLTALLSTAFTIISPKVMGLITTELFQSAIKNRNGQPGAGVDFQYIVEILLVLAGLYLISVIFGFIQQYAMVGLSQKMVLQLRKEVNDKFSRLPLPFFDHKQHGDLLSRAINDVENIGNSLQQTIIQLMTSVITLMGVFVMMFTISPVITGVVIVTLPLGLVVTKKVVSRSQPHFVSQQKKLGEMNGHIAEMYSGHEIVKAYGREESSISRYKAINEQLYEAGWKAQFISGFTTPFMSLINNLRYVIVCVFGSILVTRGAIQVGDIQAFIQYLRQLSQPVSKVSGITNQLQATIASAERVFELLDTEEEISDAKAIKTIEAPRGEVKFHHVSFSYDRDSPFLQNINLSVDPGQTVAIVGPSGGGKTTLINLLMRFYELDGGRITIDGIDITELRRRHLRDMFGMVLQDIWLFNGTIGDNIAYGKKGATNEEIVQAAKAANADHFIRTLPDGYDTVLNEDSTNLSQGQKQLLTIARAIISNPDILVLDEATSSVDPRTENDIQQALSQLTKGRTNFIIAHRPSTIRNAELIIVMKDGQMIDSGSHLELLAKGGFYADLYNSQFPDLENKLKKELVQQ